MTTDDLTRRAIIAAHNHRGLAEAEEAIVEAWRADREDYQGRYETAHASRMAAEDRLDDMTREAWTLRHAIDGKEDDHYE